jgi:hypothetical protein
MRLSDRPIFVLGCPRSGTTLFRTMLHAHRSIAIPPENRFVMGLYWRRTEFGDLRRPEARDAIGRAIVEDTETRFRFLGVDGPAVLDEIRAEGTTLGSVYGVAFRAYCRKFDKPRWGDKRPAYYAFMDELNHLFPDAQFINVVRDPRACVESLLRMEWFPDDAAPCVATWIHAVREARRSGLKLGPARYLEVQYEHLVTDPEAVSQVVCDFLGEAFDEQMCRPELIADAVNPPHYQQRQQIKQGIYTQAMEGWRTKLDPADIALIDRTAATWMKEFGYEQAGVGKASPARVARVVWLHRRYRRGTKRRRRIDARRRAYENNGLAARITTEQRQLAEAPAPVPPSVRVLRAVRPIVGPPTRPFRRALQWGRDQMLERGRTNGA